MYPMRVRAIAVYMISFVSLKLTRNSNKSVCFDKIYNCFIIFTKGIYIQYFLHSEPSIKMGIHDQDIPIFQKLYASKAKFFYPT